VSIPCCSAFGTGCLPSIEAQALHSVSSCPCSCIVVATASLQQAFHLMLLQRRLRVCAGCRLWLQAQGLQQQWYTSRQECIRVGLASLGIAHQTRPATAGSTACCCAFAC
jgi:hypothetical protein